MYYLILIGTIIAFLGSIFIIHHFIPNKEKLIVERIFIFILIAVFIVRFMSYNDVRHGAGLVRVVAHRDHFQYDWQSLLMV